jgi:DNA-directed RNA polymerase subunit M/transcription elongation factor TFIIS
MRWRESCPDCGFILTEKEEHELKRKNAFDCPRCQAHYTAEDFLAELEQKHMAQHHNHAKADLTNEEL